MSWMAWRASGVRLDFLSELRFVKGQLTINGWPQAADAVLFVTPEFNRSVPGALKNAIDVGSRPYGSSVYNGKPGAVITASPGGIGGFGANHHLRQMLAFLNVPTLTNEAYIGNAYALFDENGELINEGTTEFLKAFGQAFSTWSEKVIDDETVAKAA